MKKFFVLLVCSGFLSVSLTAQPLVKAGAQASLNSAMRRAVRLEIPFFPTVADTGLYSFQISSILKTRATDSFKTACSLQSAIPLCNAFIYGEPIYNFIKDRNFSPLTLYPDLDFLNTSAQAGNYFIARNNRLFVQEFNRLSTSLWPQVNNKLAELKHASQLTAEINAPVLWLAEKALEKNPNKIYLLEVHEFPEIQQQVTQFILHVQRLAPQRPIIVLTEFLPEGYEWQPDDDLTLSENDYPGIIDIPDYLNIWNTVTSYGVRVMGLEPQRVLADNSRVRFAHPRGFLSTQEIWTTVEGMRMRNERWKEIIDRTAAENPQALLLIYTGAAHGLYTAPSSISKGEKDAFVLAFYPAKRVIVKKREDGKEIAGTTTLTDPLERLTNFTQSFPQTVLFFSRPDLAQTAGFDGRIKIEVDLTDRLQELGRFTHGRIEK